ncbi:hypothetical protein N7462_002497 [Penicillium macrosclerotiorum]|uniref:uncharacterized protein n=1 Tax=Penicillium macrosclerotiorum TaxID=303699 RepID=UPI00254916A6|nr:uncharacterized protein N7462_002497 [Penicillium macrosclerotiorum]KAJ5693074.1 hypothetical protein N7462_002497 [Penicillium macrosclerotiorum]
MRPPRLLLVLFCLIFFPICLTFFSALSSPSVANPNTLAGRTSGLHALFSFNIPSSLFPPSAIISLTDDNSTFFLARPAAFGPLLPGKGLSGQLWVGSGFGEGGLAAGVEGELGCSDIPGWGEGNTPKNPETPSRGTEQKSGKPGSSTGNDTPISQNRPRLPSQVEPARQNERGDTAGFPSLNDGTDDHLHPAFTESSISDIGATQKYGDYVQTKQATHADIQSLQETAEIQGRVVLLSRGGCGFLEKVKWAQRRGAVAVIVGDNTRGGNLVTMYARGDTSNVTIPALFTSHTTAHLLSSLIPAHPGAATGFGDALKSFHAKLAGQVNADTQKTVTATTAMATSTPTSTTSSNTEKPAATTKSNGGGFFRTLGSLLGLCNKYGGSGPQEDSRRPPSSGNIDWMVLGSREKTTSLFDSSKVSGDRDRHTRIKSDDSLSINKLELSYDDADSDDFVIGVQDWRDPDLMPSRSSTLPVPSSTVSGKDGSKTSTADTDAASGPNFLRGGSITPGSGEYQSIDKTTGKAHDTSMKDTYVKNGNAVNAGSDVSGKGWFSSHFGWSKDPSQPAVEPSSSPSAQSIAGNQKTQDAASVSNPSSTIFSEHEGLWVTLTPTSMSTSPFFDTLLVLVVSPLLTLSVVYALLLLRSRIRRRRWRAPKSVVERLPVRTYHTISNTSSSSSSSSSPRPASPGPVSSTSPLLGTESRANLGRPNRSRSQTITGVLTDFSTTPKEEKSANPQSGSTLWRRKYTGRQVECVVCLEEYIDGQSRVMSLPCGHEFHAECITPWLTTRRRTCPICKGDVVRSLTNPYGDSQTHTEQSTHTHPQTVDPPADASSAPVLIAATDDDASDVEQNIGLLSGHASSAPQSSWRNLASLSFSALSGDTIWHQARADRNR